MYISILNKAYEFEFDITTMSAMIAAQMVSVIGALSVLQCFLIVLQCFLSVLQWFLSVLQCFLSVLQCFMSVS